MWPFKDSSKKPKETLKELTLDEKCVQAEEKIRRIDAQLVRLKKILSGPGSHTAKEGVRNQAANLLRQKKLYQNHLNTLSHHSYNLDQVNLTKESYKTTLSTYNSMKDTHKELKHISKKLNQNKLESLKDKMEDIIEKSEEFSAIIGTVDEEFVDEHELDEELAILNEEFGDTLLQSEFPTVESSTTKKEDDATEAELSQLMSELEKPKGEEQPGLVK